jgi:hypothetical protein
MHRALGRQYRKWGLSLRDSSVSKPEREELLMAHDDYVIYMIHCGSKCLRRQDIVSIEASIFGGTYAKTSSFIRKVFTAGVCDN